MRFTQQRRWRATAALVLVAILAFTLGWWARADRAGGGDRSVPLSADEISFAQRMSDHHQQALTLVDQLARDVAPDVRAIGEQIRTAQWREIGVLTGWLELAGAPVGAPEAGHGSGAGHDGHESGGDHTSMPGMASDAEITRLHNATGGEAETLFLQLMIRHHQGGIDMAAAASRQTTGAPVRARALAMVHEQQQEVATMTVLLDRRGGRPLTYP